MKICRGNKAYNNGGRGGGGGAAELKDRYTITYGGYGSAAGSEAQDKYSVLNTTGVDETKSYPTILLCCDDLRLFLIIGNLMCIGAILQHHSASILIKYRILSV